ncbi:peptidoglycan-binding protein [Clostridium sp. CF012]|uniref:peptidoglycan-binding protein n=1 Tax=Clostridium sp. CF012 TaxID=2843319 RepID=UPI001C0B8D5E|nr:peptidoglycan-binding protein [Clostridium sp. CF012]MBU3143565.1 peptidoglycan-binding protein [Clostridium sp. CF012]
MDMKFKSKILSIMAATLIVFSTYASVGAHSGRTDSKGGHYVRTAGKGYPVGSYHYHNGGSSTIKATSPSNSSASSSSTSNIKKIQQKLNDLGYSCGVADGSMGTKTKNAIKNFQRDNGLKIDGVAGKSTSVKLFN